jgi:hypothetical protein
MDDTRFLKLAKGKATKEKMEGAISMKTEDT